MLKDRRRNGPISSSRPLTPGPEKDRTRTGPLLKIPDHHWLSGPVHITNGKGGNIVDDDIIKPKWPTKGCSMHFPFRMSLY